MQFFWVPALVDGSVGVVGIGVVGAGDVIVGDGRIVEEVMGFGVVVVVGFVVVVGIDVTGAAVTGVVLLLATTKRAEHVWCGRCSL